MYRISRYFVITFLCVLVGLTILFHVSRGRYHSGFLGGMKGQFEKNSKNEIISFDARDEGILRDGMKQNNTNEGILSGGTGIQDVGSSFHARDFAKAYQQASKGNDLIKQLRILEELYDREQKRDILPFMIKLAINTYEYKSALQWMSILDDYDALLNAISIDDIFLLLFNGSSLNTQELERIKSLIVTRKQKGYLDQDSENKYLALIAYAKGDIENYQYFINQLSGTSLHSRYQNMDENNSIYNSFPDVAPYYLDALIAKWVFSQSYRNLALQGSDRVLSQDSMYILPRQIILYASLFLKHYDRVHKMSERLGEYDEENEQLYMFLDAIAYFEEKDYANALLKFRNVRHDSYFSDIQRYLLLLYYQIGDERNLKKILENILDDEDILVYDFYTAFNIFFYFDIEKNKDFLFFARYPSLAFRYLQQCYQKLGKEYAYICLYGKTGFLLANEQYEKAYQYLQRLVKRYPKYFLYENLGKIAYTMGKYDDAKRRFLQALQYAGYEDKNDLIQRVMNILNDE